MTAKSTLRPRKAGKPRSKSLAPGQFLGYSLQTTQMLLLLIQSEKDWKVSLEVFEDVGVEKQDGHKTARQVKSTLGRNPISNRSADFWKTFANWVDAIQSKILDPEKTRFEIYVSRENEGEIAKSFSEASTIESAKAAFEGAKGILETTKPKQATFPREKSVIAFVEKVLRCPEALTLQLIKNFSLQFGSGNSFSDLLKSAAWTFVPEDIHAETLTFALGWVKKTCDELIERKEAAIIPVNDFRLAVNDFIRKHDRKNMLGSFAPSPHEKDIKAGMIKKYVRQLDLIGSEEEVKIQAVTDFLKASSDRTTWSVKGWIQQSSLDEFETGLTRIWRNLRDKVNVSHQGLKDIERGKLLYSECSLHKAKMNGLEIPDHFTPGSFHALADNEILGWHPDFKNMLKEKKADK